MIEHLGDCYLSSHLTPRAVPRVLLQRVLELREGRHRPVKGRNVDLVHRLGARRRQRAERAAVEAAGEAHDGQARRAGRLVQHARAQLLLREGERALALLVRVVHEGGLEGALVGAEGAREMTSEQREGWGGERSA